AAQRAAGDKTDAPMTVTAEELRKCRRVMDSGGLWSPRRSFMEFSLQKGSWRTRAFVRVVEFIPAPTEQFVFSIQSAGANRRVDRTGRARRTDFAPSAAILITMPFHDTSR